MHEMKINVDAVRNKGLSAYAYTVQQGGVFTRRAHVITGLDREQACIWGAIEAVHVAAVKCAPEKLVLTVGSSSAAGTMNTWFGGHAKCHNQDTETALCTLRAVLNKHFPEFKIEEHDAVNFYDEFWTLRMAATVMLRKFKRDGPRLTARFAGERFGAALMQDTCMEKAVTDTERALASTDLVLNNFSIPEERELEKLRVHLQYAQRAFRRLNMQRRIARMERVAEQLVESADADAELPGLEALSEGAAAAEAAAEMNARKRRRK